MNTAIEGEVIAKQARGRIDSDGQEAIIKLDPVRAKIDELQHLYFESREAAEAFSDAIKAVAEEAGLNAKALRTFVKASVDDKLEEKQRECEQLTLLFEEVKP